jgi:hypothetical protein
MAGIVNIRARNLIARLIQKREDVLKERLPLCASTPNAVGQSAEGQGQSAVAQSEEPECRHLQC